MPISQTSDRCPASSPMPTALITGVTGQDGSYLADALLADGWQVHGLVKVPDPGLDALLDRAPAVTVHEGDLGHPDDIDALVATVQPDHIYNLGGVSSVAVSWDRPVLTAAVTGLAAASLLESAWRLQQARGREVRVLQASSAEIFGVPEYAPQDEDTPIRPVTPYGAAKAYAHHMVCVYRSRGLHASSCILYNHESPRRPDTFVTRKITKAAAAIAAGEHVALELGSLDARRDWGWAPDYVDAMRRAVERPVPDDYVIATGRAHSVRDFVVAAFEYAGVPDWERFVVVDPKLMRPADAHEQVGNAAKAKAELDWVPSVDFEDLVRRMVDADRRPSRQDAGTSTASGVSRSGTDPRSSAQP
jgi:GDPmannose 4,6-dehydratase